MLGEHAEIVILPVIFKLYPHCFDLVLETLLSVKVKHWKTYRKNPDYVDFETKCSLAKNACLETG